MREGLRVYSEIGDAPRVPSRYALAYAEQRKQREEIKNRCRLLVSDPHEPEDPVPPEGYTGQFPDVADAPVRLFDRTPARYGPFDANDHFSGKPRADASVWI